MVLSVVNFQGTGCCPGYAGPSRSSCSSSRKGNWGKGGRLSAEVKRLDFYWFFWLRCWVEGTCECENGQEGSRVCRGCSSHASKRWYSCPQIRGRSSGESRHASKVWMWFEVERAATQIFSIAWAVIQLTSNSRSQLGWEQAGIQSVDVVFEPDERCY